MGDAGRLIAFAGILGVTFAAAVGVGAAVGPDREGAAAPAAHGGGHAEAAAARPVRGLARTADGLTLALDRTTAPRGRRFALRFRITEASGATVRDFDVEHTKRMHLIVVRRDLTGFQHLHPRQGRDGSWAVPATLPAAGSYRVLADFTTDGKPSTLGTDLHVDGPVRSQPLPPPARAVTTDGLRVTRGAGLDFSVAGVALQDYLGAKGHLVALREGDLAFLHVHPDADRLSFAADFPSAGRYRLFLQFRTGGRVHTAAFTEQR